MTLQRRIVSQFRTTWINSISKHTGIFSKEVLTTTSCITKSKRLSFKVLKQDILRSWLICWSWSLKGSKKVYSIRTSYITSHEKYRTSKCTRVWIHGRWLNLGGKRRKSCTIRRFPTVTNGEKKNNRQLKRIICRAGVLLLIRWWLELWGQITYSL